LTAQLGSCHEWLVRWLPPSLYLANPTTVNGSANGSIRVATIDPAGHDHRNVSHGGNPEPPGVTTVFNAAVTDRGRV